MTRRKTGRLSRSVSSKKQSVWVCSFIGSNLALYFKQKDCANMRAVGKSRFAIGIRTAVASRTAASTSVTCTVARASVKAQWKLTTSTPIGIIERFRIERRTAFKWRLGQWIYFGGYPGAAALVEDEAVWKRYVNDSFIGTVLAREVFQMQTVTKPTLLRHLFALAAHFPAQMFSFNKMLGQLTDAGNTVTLANYLRLLETAFLASGLELFSKGQARKRGSSPKLVLWDNALVSATVLKTFEQAFADGS